MVSFVFVPFLNRSIEGVTRSLNRESNYLLSPNIETRLEAAHTLRRDLENYGDIVRLIRREDVYDPIFSTYVTNLAASVDFFVGIGGHDSFALTRRQRYLTDLGRLVRNIRPEMDEVDLEFLSMTLDRNFKVKEPTQRF